MAIVYIGSARIDEHGNARGGSAGDQKGKEVSAQPWYRHSSGWVVIRAKSAEVRKKIADAMRKACDNNMIGYDQNQRDTLYNAVKPFGFDPSKVTIPCETDCSALVRVCCAYAGIMVNSFRTYNQPAVLKGTGQFDVLTDSAYTRYSDKLLTGDILCTPVSGHTVVVLNDGANASAPTTPTTPSVTVLRLGSFGPAVLDLQKKLNEFGFDCGKADSDFGKMTEAGVKEFQKVVGIEVDGIVGPQTFAALASYKKPVTPPPAPKPEPVIIPATVRRGDKGSVVKQLQVELNKEGFSLLVDSDFGPKTGAAVVAFQKKKGLIADEVVGPITWRALLS